MDVRLPNGSVIRGVPEDATKSQIMEKAIASGLAEPGDFGIDTKTENTPTSSKSFTDKAINYLPIAGGIVGGLFGNVPGAVLGGAAGESYKQLYNRYKGYDAPETGMEAATDIAKEGGIQGALQGVGQYVIAPAMKYGGQRLMQSALKPSAAMGKNAPRATQTMLDEGLNVSRGGLDKLVGLIDDVNNSINTAVSKVKANISPAKAAEAVNDTVRKFSNQVNNVDDLASIQKVVDEFLATRGKSIPVQLAQEIKVNTNQIIASKYGELGNASTEAQKAIVRGLKEEIAKVVPGVAELNARDSALYNLLPALQQRVGVASNANPFGISLLAESMKPGAAHMLDRSAIGKSLLSRGLYNSATPVGILAPRAGYGLSQ